MSIKYLGITTDEPLQFVKIRCKVKRQPMYDTLKTHYRLDYDDAIRAFILMGDFIQKESELPDDELFSRFCFSGKDEGYFLVYSLKRAALVLENIYTYFKQKHIKPFEIQWNNSLYNFDQDEPIRLYREGGDPFVNKAIVEVNPDAFLQDTIASNNKAEDEQAAFKAMIYAITEEERKPFPDWESRKIDTSKGGNMETLPGFLSMRAVVCAKRFLGEESYSHSDLLQEENTTA